MQGTKDAGYEFYQFLSKVLLDIGMVSNTICKGVFVRRNNTMLSFLLLATDDMSFATNSSVAVQQLETEFKKYFAFTCKRGTELSFLNFRIIQSKYGISLDQTNHIQQKVLTPYFLDRKKFHSSQALFLLIQILK